MFEARKRVFVDLLKWDVPVLEGRYEVDQFDDEHARYIIVSSRRGDHLASARLLPTTRPHILDTLFPDLVAGEPPRGPDILEITRFCLERGCDAAERRSARNRLVSALVVFAIGNGVRTFTGVAEQAWLQQVLGFGWKCRPLGLPRLVSGSMTGALRIDINEETPRLLEHGGIWAAEAATAGGILEAA
jgi:acyl-homoserine lactone synthase